MGGATTTHGQCSALAGAAQWVEGVIALVDTVTGRTEIMVTKCAFMCF